MRALIRIVSGHRSLALWAGLFVLATFWVWQRYAVVQTGNTIAQLRARIVDLTETRDALLVETTTLSSRSRIEAIAASHLGLQTTVEEQWRRLPVAVDSAAASVEQAQARPSAGDM